jgi:hypothetical protein
MIHDSLNDKTFAWKPEWAANYREHATDDGSGVIGYDGLLLDGWNEVQGYPGGRHGRRTQAAHQRTPAVELGGILAARRCIRQFSAQAVG